MDPIDSAKLYVNGCSGRYGPESVEALAEAVSVFESRGFVVESCGWESDTKGERRRRARILAAPLSLVGSIGVFFGRFDLSDALSTVGLRRDLLTRGAHAGLGHPLRPMTGPERQAAEALVEEIYQDFLGIVATARRRTKEEIRPLAGGRVYSGLRAAAKGLIDRVASYEEAIAELARLAGLPDRRPSLRRIEAGTRGLAALRELASGTAQLLAPQPLSLLVDLDGPPA